MVSILLLLNNDVEVINKDWLTKYASLAQREDVGCVGAKLYYPDNTIQHGGIIVGLGEQLHMLIEDLIIRNMDIS